jgi:hypothetical protein
LPKHSSFGWLDQEFSPADPAKQVIVGSLEDMASMVEFVDDTKV